MAGQFYLEYAGYVECIHGRARIFCVACRNAGAVVPIGTFT